MDYSLQDGKVVRKDGWIALQHRNSNPTGIIVDKITYSFVAQHNVSLCWVRPDHVNRLLQEQARICCGQTGKKFFLASIINVNIWSTGDRDGQN